MDMRRIEYLYLRSNAIHLMTELFGFVLPFVADGISQSFILTQLVGALFAAFALVIADKYIGHNIEIKRALFLALTCFFVVPVLLPFTGMNFPYMNVFAPLVVWMALGEMMLVNDFTVKLKVLAVAFFFYYVLNIAAVSLLLGRL